MKNVWSTVISGAGLVALLAAPVAAQGAPIKLLPPEQGAYHGVFADLPEFLRTGEAAQGTISFEQLVQKGVAFSIIGDNWVEGITFPRRAVQEVTDAGRIPVVHIKPWSVKRRGEGVDPLYSLQRLLAGRYDLEIRNYAKAVKTFGKPVVLDFAPEANGDWYPWSGAFVGNNNAAGPQAYKDTYKKFVTLFRTEGVENVTWVFHMASGNKPNNNQWNNMAAYYPGDEFVDWLALSVYSAQLPGDSWEEFTEHMDAAYAEMAAVTEQKPIAVLEFGIIEDPFSALRKADWITNALAAVKANRYPRVKAMAYWHESSWLRSGDNNMRVDSSVSALRAYKQEVADPFFVSTAVLTAQPNQPEGCLCGWVNGTNGARGCAIWKEGEATVKEFRRFSQCDIAVCQQLFSASTYQACGGANKVRMFQQ